MIQFNNSKIKISSWADLLISKSANAVTAIILLFTYSLTTVAAQEIVFRSTLNKNKVVSGETFQISFTLENADGKNFTPPSFNDFYVVGGPNQSTNMQFINGSMTRAVSFSYFLQPKKEGLSLIHI